MKKDSFEKILKENQNVIERFCTVYAKTTEDKKDLFQEIVFNIWKSIPRFKGESHINTFVYKISLRVAMNFYKKEKRRKARIDSFVEQTESRNDKKGSYTEEQLNALNSGISMLNEIDRYLVALFLEELSYREIAEIMGISENLVAVKMKRVKNKLINLINKSL